MPVPLQNDVRLNHPDNELNYTENFLKMCFAVPAEKYKVNKKPIISIILI